ncbi:elongation factor G [Alienimonas sp. DA493]|uniref:elongation factor G n=1 Tax=Alienimonas sp. DA493 TaxID=3373605 RepID=UPI00375508A2
MNDFLKNLDKHRNIGISAHIDSGKTTLTERILFYSGKTHKIGDVKKEGAVMDSMELEKEKGITIASAATSVTWKDYSINIIDTPGHVDFTVEVERSLRVLDGAILVLCSVGGVQSQSLTVDRQMKRYQIPRIAFINKCDRTGADPFSVTEQMAAKLHVTPVPLQIPIGLEESHEGVVDLIAMKAYYFDGEKGEKVRVEEIPAELLDQAKEKRGEMLESLSLYNDELMEKLLEEAEIPEKMIHDIVRETTLSHQIVPVMMGSAYKNKGVQPLLDAINQYLPSPLERDISALDQDNVDEDGKASRVPLKPEADLPTVAMAFKIVQEQFGQLTYTRIYQGTINKGDSYINTRTGQKTRFGRLVRMHANDRADVETAGPGDIIAVVGMDCASGDTFCGDGVNYSLENIFVADAVITRSLTPLKREGADKLGKALERFRREDPTFRVFSDEETGETLIAGMGQLHLDIYVERIRREYKVECEVGPPRVAYKERPTKATDYDHKHKKQTGGSGQYGHVKGTLEPMTDEELEAAEEPFEFVNDITQGRIPREYIPAIEKGMRRGIEKGPLGEFEVVGVRMILNDGSYHDVDSSEMAFNTTGFQAMRETLKKANVKLQEPIMKLEIECPEEFQGPVTGHVSSKRGMIVDSSTKHGTAIVEAEVPLAEMFDYANELRSMTQGKGNFSMEFSKYAQVPANIQEEVLKARQEQQEAKAAMK